MVTKVEYASLSARVYRDARGGDNANPLPPGWEEITYNSDMKNNPFTSGLSAGVYRKGDQIVIAFKGTDFLFGTNGGQTLADLKADLALGFGLGSSQIIQAAALYAQVKSDPLFKGDSISFTGHSLGAGLASIMSVWFDQPAIVFANAPFKASALNGSLAEEALKAAQANGYAAPELASLIFEHAAGDEPISYSINDSVLNGRQSNVASYYVQGEVLNKVFGTFLNIVGAGANNPIVIGDGDKGI